MPRATTAPPVRLGARDPDGIAPAVFAMVERGVHKRPTLARRLHGEVELRFSEEIRPVRIAFEGERVLVEDGAPAAPALVVAGRLPDIVTLIAAPQVRGVPNPAKAGGRAAIARLARRHVTITGEPGLGRSLLQLLQV